MTEPVEPRETRVPRSLIVEVDGSANRPSQPPARTTFQIGHIVIERKTIFMLALMVSIVVVPVLLAIAR